MKAKVIRITTIPISLKVLLRDQLKFMRVNGLDMIGVSSPGRELNEVSSSQGVKVVPLNMTRTISPLNDLKSLWNFYRLCKRERPSIVHSHTPKAGIIGMLGSWLAGVPIRMHTVAGLPLMEARGAKRVLLNLVEKITYACATRVYPNSFGLQSFIIRNQFAPASKVKVIAEGSSNGVDVEYFNPNRIDTQQRISLRCKLGIDESDFVFIFIGRIVGDKGVNELISAFCELNKPSSLDTPSGFKLLIIGNFEKDLDPIHPESEREIKYNRDIVFVGYQTDVRPYLAVSDCLVFPSYREGFPNVVMQAGAMGLPSIVSDINGCNEIVIEGINGMIVPPKNLSALKNAMIHMASEKEYFNSLQKRTREMITLRFEQKVLWKTLLDEYNSLLSDVKL